MINFFYTDEYLNHLYTTMNNDNNNNSTMNNIKIMIMDDHQIRVTNVSMRLAPMQVFEKFNDIKTKKEYTRRTFAYRIECLIKRLRTFHQ